MNWSNVSDIVTQLQKKWRSGRYLQEFAAGVEWTPLMISVRSPRPNELLEYLEEITAWLAKFEREARNKGLVVEYRTLRSRNVGENRVPARVRVESLMQLCTTLGVTNELRSFEKIYEQTKATLPAATDWVTNNPMSALSNADIWPQLLSTVQWIAEKDVSSQYLRHIDVKNVDTKFVESNRKILDKLLIHVLPAERVNIQNTDFAGRYGFKRKPWYIRLRTLSSPSPFPTGLSELTLRADELATLEPSVQRVFIVENEVSYLAFPDTPDAIVIFGAGFALESLKLLAWLDNKTILYWGDIDTHGFDMLSRLRERFANVKSILMDGETLLQHRLQWVEEPSPIRRRLDHLTESEAEFYRDLVEGHYGHNVRLEQERVRFGRVAKAVAASKP